jgi:hypothetical protein
MDLWHVPAVDQHAHNVVRPDGDGRLPFREAFSESADRDVLSAHVHESLSFRRGVRDLAALLECDPTEEAVLARRRDIGLERLAERCFAASGLETVLLDDGFLPDAIVPVEWHRQFVDARRVLRLEAVAEDLMPDTRSLEELLERFRVSLDPPPAGVVAFKSVAAYRRGLRVDPTASLDAARGAFDALARAPGGGRPRIVDAALVDLLLLEALEVASAYELPVQLHTGFGDADLDLREANPLHLRPLLESGRAGEAPIVLLHASYPYAREAGYLASIYPRVYLDVGLAVPSLSVSGMRETVRQLLELAPATKLMYSSDAHMIPELFYLGARWGRDALGHALEGAVRDGDLTVAEADRVARLVLADTARALYGL